jgi:hypothetical protein
LNCGSRSSSVGGRRSSSQSGHALPVPLVIGLPRGPPIRQVLQDEAPITPPFPDRCGRPVLVPITAVAGEELSLCGLDEFPKLLGRSGLPIDIFSEVLVFVERNPRWPCPAHGTRCPAAPNVRADQYAPKRVAGLGASSTVERLSFLALYEGDLVCEQGTNLRPGSVEGAESSLAVPAAHHLRTSPAGLRGSSARIADDRCRQRRREDDGRQEARAGRGVRCAQARACRPAKP